MTKITPEIIKPEGLVKYVTIKDEDWFIYEGDLYLAYADSEAFCVSNFDDHKDIDEFGLVLPVNVEIKWTRLGKQKSVKLRKNSG